MEDRNKFLEQLVDDYSAVLKEAKLMSCNEIRALYNIPLENMELIVKALKKQIPKKVARPSRSEMGYDYKDYACPACGCFLGYEPKIKSVLLQRRIPCRYCNNCGQKLDFGG